MGGREEILNRSVEGEEGKDPMRRRTHEMANVCADCSPTARLFYYPFLSLLRLRSPPPPIASSDQLVIALRAVPSPPIPRPSPLYRAADSIRNSLSSHSLSL